MLEFFQNIAPNVVKRMPEMWECLGDTLFMMGLSGGISFLLGLFFGIVITVTRPHGIMENKVIYNILDKMINIFRSIPFIVLLALLIPLTRLIVGTAIGTRGAIVPLIFGTVPFFTRQIETALLEVDGGLIEAAQSMGVSPFKIITRVMLRESIPGIVRGTMITLVNLVGLTAMAGAIGGGGLGDFAIRYGHQRNQTDITIATVIILLIVVSLIQWLGALIVKRTTH